MFNFSNKEFELKDKRLKITNASLKNHYTDMRALGDNLKNKDDFLKKQNHLNLLDYLNQLIIFDETQGVNLLSDDGSVKEFNFNDLKEELILYTDIVSIMGRILLDSFKKENFHFAYEHDWAVEINKMIKYSIDELARMREEINRDQEKANPNPYGVNCVLVSLVESELKYAAKIRYIKAVCNDAYTKIQSGQLCLNSSDQDYFEEMYNAYINNITLPNGRNNIIASGPQFKGFIDRNNLSLNYSNDFEQKIFYGEMTLNQLVNIPEETNTWEPLFLSAMKNIFGTSRLNIRNCLAHCGYTMYNYHSPYTAYIFNELLFLICKDYYLR